MTHPGSRFNADENADLRRQVRDVGKGQEKYRMKLLERPDLLVFTGDTVLTRFRNLIEADSKIEEILNRYFT